MAAGLIYTDCTNLFARCNATVQGYVNVRQSFSTSTPVVGRMYANERFPMVTGSWNDGKYNWLHVQTLDGTKGYVRGDYATAVRITASASQSDAQSLMDEITASNKNIYDWVLKISDKIAECEKKGLNVKAQKEELANINYRLNQRQKAIEAGKDKWFSKVTNSASSLWDKCKSAYQSLMAKISGVGAVPAIVVVAIACVVIAASATVVYILFKPQAEQAKVDEKKCPTLFDVVSEIAKTDPEKAQKIRDEVQDLANDQYNKGKTDGTWGGMFDVIKPIVFMGAGWFLVNEFLLKQGKRK